MLVELDLQFLPIRPVNWNGKEAFPALPRPFIQNQLRPSIQMRTPSSWNTDELVGARRRLDPAGPAGGKHLGRER